MTNILEIKLLNKLYGPKRALNNVDLSIPAGTIVGLCGANGSGKTTLMQIIAGLSLPTSGVVSVCGRPIGKETKALVAYMPDNSNIYGKMSTEDVVRFYADFFSDFEAEKARSLIRGFGLSSSARASNMSKGEVEKLQLALTLSRSAKLYLLDEPMSGIDKVARNEIIDLIIDHSHEGASMLISTHHIGEMERVFENVAFLKQGKVVLQGDCDSLRDQHRMSIENLYVEVCTSAE